MTTCLWSMAAFWLAMLLLMGYLAYTAPTLPDYDDDGEW